MPIYTFVLGTHPTTINQLRQPKIINHYQQPLSTNYHPTIINQIFPKQPSQKKKNSNLGPFLKLLKFHHLKPLVLSKGNPKGTVQMLAPSIPSNQKKLLGCPIEVSKSLVSGL